MPPPIIVQAEPTLTKMDLDLLKDLLRVKEEEIFTLKRTVRDLLDENSSLKKGTPPAYQRSILQRQQQEITDLQSRFL